MKVCIDCGQEFSYKELNRKGRCLECAFKAMTDAIEQLAKRDGPFFEKWLDAKEKAVANYRASMEKAVKRYAESFDAIEHWCTPEGQAEMIFRIGNLKSLLGDE